MNKPASARDDMLSGAHLIRAPLTPLVLEERDTAIAQDPSRPLIVDVDDTILDWIGAWGRHMSEVTGREIVGRPSDWDMSKWLGLEKEEYVPLLLAFNASDAFGTLEALPDAKEALDKISRIGRRIHVITSCSSDKHTISLRTNNLVDAFGDIFSSITCLDLGVAKTQRLREIMDAEGEGVWVEDNHERALEGKIMGHTTFVIRRSHNRALESQCDKSLTWVDCWRPIVHSMGIK